jgi:hypothetical protein
VAFFFERIARALRNLSAELANEVREGWSRALTPGARGELSMADEFVGMSKTIFGSLLIAPIIRSAQKKLRQVEDQARVGNPQTYERTAKQVDRALGLIRVLAGVMRSMGLVGYALAICIALALYVWEFYPEIPQSLGGGRPSTVTLVVDLSALPKNLTPETQSAPSNVVQSGKETVSLPVTLLYLTAGAYFVQTESGIRMSIKADAVKSVIWVQPTDKVQAVAGAPP